MDLQLTGDTAVVVGGAKGIGRAIAEMFAREQCQVELMDIDSCVESTAEQITSSSQQPARGQVVDATDYESLQAAAQQVDVESPHQLHLICAAGCGSGKFGFPFWNLAPQDWEPVLAVNLLGAVNATHAFVPHLLHRPGSTVLFLSSVAGQIGSQTDPPYSAAKAALINFAQCAAKDLAAEDVRVNVISPGMVATDVNRSVWQAWFNQQPPDQRLDYSTWAGDKVRRIAPLGRWQTGDDIAAAAAFLASRQAKNITGQTINVDGGQVMHS